MLISRQVFKSEWANGATIDVYYYMHPAEGHDISDRINLVITPAEGHGKVHDLMMNIQDATDIIFGLSKAMSQAIEDQMPAVCQNKSFINGTIVDTNSNSSLKGQNK